MIHREDARRLYVEATSAIVLLDRRLLESSEGEYLGVDPFLAQRLVPGLIKKVGDRLNALANLAPIANGFISEVGLAIADALNKPDAMGSPPEIDPNGFLPEEEYIAVMEFRALANRLADVYGLNVLHNSYAFFTTPQKQLAVMCENIGGTVERMVTRKMLGAPTREEDVKQILYGCCLSAFPDVVPDGQIKFKRLLKGYKPDLGVPGLKTCVELKIARDMNDVAKVLEQVVVDMSAYGDDDYTTFLSVIYTNDPTVTNELVSKVVQDKLVRLGADPLYSWRHVVAQGPLAPSARASTTKTDTLSSDGSIGDKA